MRKRQPLRPTSAAGGAASSGDVREGVVAEGVPESPPVIEADDLLQGRSEVRIRYNGQEYRLSTTRQGKLILTK